MMRSILGLCLLALLISTAEAGKIYRWVDKDGQVHYGERPPSDKANEINIKAKPKTTTPAHQTEEQRKIKQKKLLDSFAHERREKEQHKDKKRKDKVKLKVSCDQARAELKNYLRASRLYKYDEKGDRQFLSDEQKQQQENKLKQNIQKHCK